MTKCAVEGCEDEHVATVPIAQKAGSPVQFPDVEYPVCEKHRWSIKLGDPYDVKTEAIGDKDAAIVLAESERSS